MTVQTTGPISSGGVLTATAPPSGTIPGGSGATLALLVNYLVTGITYQFTEFGALVSHPAGAYFNGAAPTGLTNGTYTNIALSSQCGVATGVKASIIVSGGTISATSGVTITAGGSNCVPIDTFTFPLASMGGSGNATWSIAGTNSSLSAPAVIDIDAYGTGGTTGSGGAGTYQTTATGAALDPSTQIVSVSAYWYAYSGGSPPATGFAAPGNQMQPAPEVSVLAFKTQQATLIPPTPLPQTATGTQVTSSYSS